MKKSLALLYNVEYNNTVDREKGQQKNKKQTTKKKGFKTMNALQEKINRYKLYIVQDHALIEAHPTKTAYKNRLKNHRDKLNRLLEKQEKELNPPPSEEPQTHPGITFSEYPSYYKK